MYGLPIKSLVDVWDNNLARFPRKTGVIWEDRGYSFAELHKQVEGLRGSLVRKFGLSKQEKVCFLLPNCFEYYIGYWSVVRSGAVVVPVNVRLKPESIAGIIRHVEARIVFVHGAVVEKAVEALKDCPDVEVVIGVGTTHAGWESYESLVEGPAPPEPPTIDPTDLVIIMHTSGTTGDPKGVMITHENIFFNNKNAIFAQGFRHEDIHLLVVPMFHCTALYTMLPLSAYQGSTILIYHRPEPRELVELIQKHRVTTFSTVPTMCYFLTNLKGLDQYDLRSLRLIAYAGAPMPPATIRRLREKFPGVWLHNFFGLTETISLTHVLADRYADVHPDSIGKLLPEVLQRIVDDDGNDVPPGEVGELCFHKYNVTQGYWKRPDLFQAAMLGDWFRTGDLARTDEDGFVYLKGRKKDMIIVGGENVYALEVESTILSHPKVMEAAVVGVEATGAFAYLGELIKAVVVPKEGETITEREIKKHCADNLPTYKVPHFVEFRDSLPRNPSGKVLKRELK